MSAQWTVATAAMAWPGIIPSGMSTSASIVRNRRRRGMAPE